LLEQRAILDQSDSNFRNGMSRINLKRAIVFICILGCIAIVLYAWQYHREQQKAAEIAAAQLKNEQETAARKEAEAEQQHNNEITAAAQQEMEGEKRAALEARQEAANEHARFIAQYENTNFTRTPGIELIAVACAAENGTMNEAIGAALASRFKTGKIEPTTSFFKPTLITDGLFTNVFNGSGNIFNTLELPNYLDGLLLARQDVQFATNADLNNVVTADMHIQIEALPVSGSIEGQSWTLAAKGTGFNTADARMQAEERIIKQIGGDPTMSLKQSGGNH
jgi:hypothetical protein